MSLVDNGLWHPEKSASRRPKPRSSVPARILRPLKRLVAALGSQPAVSVSNNSLRTRLLLDSVAGPLIAYSAISGLSAMPQPQWIISVAAVSALAGAVIAKSAVTQALRPLNDLALAASRLDISGSIARVSEHCPVETSSAAKAFNDMSEQVAREFEERIQFLSAFSHDVQTPITRMRLRVELADHFPDRDKILRDLREAECLVKDGIAYARNSHLTRESDALVDLFAFVESIALDYQDTGRDVSMAGICTGKRAVKPAALRRILSNFTDNALKFAGAAEISLSRTAEGGLVIAVLDRGPGIPAESLEAAMKPFVRLQHSTAGEIPGVGLGLAIAQQLAHEMNASILLQNRDGGGLSAQVVFPA